MISGRLVLGDQLRIDDSLVLGIDSGGEDDGQFGLHYLTPCDACDSSGYVRGLRCQWCHLREPAAETGAEYVALPIAMMSLDDMGALRKWAARQQFMPTAPGNERLAASIIDAVASYEAALVSAPTERSPQVAA